MKTLRPFLVLFIALFTVSACKKEKEESDNLGLVGEWEIRSSVGGLSPSAEFPEGNGKILKFSETGYQRLENGKVIKSGTYQIIEEKFWAGNYRIIFDGDLTGLTQYIEISKDKLTIYSGAPIALDGLETVYVRK